MESNSWYEDSFLDPGYKISDSDNVEHINYRGRTVIELGTMTSTSNNTPFTPLLRPSRGNEIINYKTTDGLKTYKRATEALKDEYDGKALGIAVFRMQLLARAKAEAWMNSNNADIINIPKDGINKSNGTINIIKEHSQISNNAIKQWATNNLVRKTLVDRCDQNN